MRNVGPPVRLRLDVPQDHVFDRRGQPGHFPGDVGFPAAPGFRQVLEDGPGFVALDALRHHVEDVVHHSGAQLEVEMTLNALLGHGLRDSLRVAAFELPRQKVAEPALEERHDPAEEKEPDTPARCPEAAARAFAHRTRIEAVVDEMLEILAHADLTHEAVLVAVHARQLSDVRERVLEPVRKLEGVHISKAVLNDGVHHELRKAQDLAGEVEGITEA
mmetsp:Transcript_13659/g.18096  ORF Transcript_13659/g.18096 Transcript_13659/m.18096 type:complete len:218 (-) Transcript_13659:2714-3367(-)